MRSAKQARRKFNSYHIKATGLGRIAGECGDLDAITEWLPIDLFWVKRTNRVSSANPGDTIRIATTPKAKVKAFKTDVDFITEVSPF
jgi:hypothetical protein